MSNITINIDVPEDDNIKDLKENKIEIGAYMRSELTDVDAPKSKSIDRMRNNSKRNEKKSKKKRKSFFGGTVTVHYLGSEDLPENKVQMIYEPETRNFSVKGMFAILSMLHFLTSSTAILLFTHPDLVFIFTFRNEIYGKYCSVSALGLLLIIILSVVCYQRMRIGFCSSFAVFSSWFLLSLLIAGISHDYGNNFLVYAVTSAFFSDIACVIVGCTQFDYTSMAMYGIALTTGLIFLALAIPGMPFGFYWTVFYHFGELKQLTPIAIGSSVIFTVIYIAAIIGELHILLDDETVQMAEDDYTFGAYLMYVSLIDFPIRFMRKRGYLDIFEQPD